MKPRENIGSGIMPNAARWNGSDALHFSEPPRRSTFVRVPSWRALSSYLSRFDWTWVPIICVGLADLVLAEHFGMSFVGWRRFCLVLAVPVAVTIYYRVWRRSEQLADTGYYTTAWVLFSTLGCILTYVAARVDYPLRDVQFAGYDALLGFDWGRWAAFVALHRKLELLLEVGYATILPQTLGSVIYFAHTRRPDRNDDLLWTTMLAAIIATVLSALLPALGPHLKGQYVVWSATLAAIRAGSASSFSLEHLLGIIDFPSFHTVAAILLVYAHRPPLPYFRVVVILNLLMLLSIPSEGQHYLVDMISGAVVAAIAIAAVRIATRSRAPRRQILLRAHRSIKPA